MGRVPTVPRGRAPPARRLNDPTIATTDRIAGHAARGHGLRTGSANAAALGRASGRGRSEGQLPQPDARHASRAARAVASAAVAGLRKSFSMRLMALAMASFSEGGACSCSARSPASCS
jgi:hypothetical protein